MKARKAADLRNLNQTELTRSLRDAEETLMNLRFQHAIGELQNTAYLKTIRNDIARIKSVMRERELSGKSIVN